MIGSVGSAGRFFHVQHQIGRRLADSDGLLFDGQRPSLLCPLQNQIESPAAVLNFGGRRGNQSRRRRPVLFFLNFNYPAGSKYD